MNEIESHDEFFSRLDEAVEQTGKMLGEHPNDAVFLDIELQLDIIVDRMRREFKVECNVGNPQVAYRETIRKAVMNQEYTHKKQTGGSGQFAKVLMNFEPLNTEEGETYDPPLRRPLRDGEEYTRDPEARRIDIPF